MAAGGQVLVRGNPNQGQLVLYGQETQKPVFAVSITVAAAASSAFFFFLCTETMWSLLCLIIECGLPRFIAGNSFIEKRKPNKQATVKRVNKFTAPGKF